jgi:dTDP-4-amino-4,6-dideoxygalactose transaminase
MNVPFLDLRAAYLELKPEIDAAIARVLDSGWYILGPEVEAFETEWAAYCSSSHAVGVGNGLDAITLALRALEIGPGDEVIVPSNTYIATWLAVSAVGATPVPVEPHPATYNIDPTRIAAAITPATRALLPVHLYGQPADLDPILALAQRYNLFVVEDAAQAHGARYKGRRIGSHGDVVCWSFYPGKNLGAMGDAGAITTNRADLADRIRVLRNYGSRTKYINEVQGVNSRLDPLQAAVLRVKLKALDTWNDRRRLIAKLYAEALVNSDLLLPHVAEWADSAWHLYVVRSTCRDAFQAYLSNNGINTLIHYPVLPHQQAAFSNSLLSGDLSFSVANAQASELLSLPIGPHLKEDAVSFIIEKITSSDLRA